MLLIVTLFPSTSVTVTGSFWADDPSTGFGSGSSGTSVRPRRVCGSGKSRAACEVADAALVDDVVTDGTGVEDVAGPWEAEEE